MLNSSIQKLLKVDNAAEVEIIDSQLQDCNSNYWSNQAMNQDITTIGEQIIQLKEQKQNILLSKASKRQFKAKNG
jgi:site-specific DNA recombinase